MRTRVCSPQELSASLVCAPSEDEHPDWEKLGGDYFVASWERRGLHSSAAKEEVKASSKPASQLEGTVRNGRPRYRGESMGQRRAMSQARYEKISAARWVVTGL